MRPRTRSLSLSDGLALSHQSLVHLLNPRPHEVRRVMQDNQVWKAAGSTDEGRGSDRLDFDDEGTELTRESSRDSLCWFPAERLPDRWNGKDHGGTCAMSVLARTFLSHCCDQIH